MKTVIMAGGKGTRIAEAAPLIPKPLIELCGKPVLQHEIECLVSQGFVDIIITVSHMADKIMGYFGDGGRFGARIEYFVEEKPLGSAGALFRLRDRLSEDFLLLNADSLFDIDLNRFTAYHREKQAFATIFTHPNSHPYDSGLIEADENGAVTAWLAKEDARPEWYHNRVNAGLHILSPKVLDMCGSPEKADLDRQLLKPLCGTGKLFCYDSPEYVRDMGTPDRLESVRRDLASGLTAAKSLRTRQKAVFLDRDGTLNRYVGFLRTPEQLELLPDTAEAVRLINESGYLAVVVTNQPVIARGEVTFEGLDLIHRKLETLLGREGAYIDGLYFCPHHPDKGFEGEVAELKTDCGCRKPKPGMLLKAAEDFSIDLAESFMIGDSENDIGAGKAAGCRTVLLGSGSFGQDFTADSLLSAVKHIIGGMDK